MERTNTANSLGADLYISNHVNSGGGCGSEVWYSIVGGDSKEYAVAASNALSDIFVNRGAKTRMGDGGKDYYHVIRETSMPAIIIEHGFIDCASDADILKNEQSLKRMARSVVNAIRACLAPR